MDYNQSMTIQELLKALSPHLQPQPQPQQKPEEPLCPPIELAPTQDLAKQKRCGCCKKKLTLTDFSCDKCQTRFCVAHRLPEEHICSHDFKAAGKNQLTKQLVSAIADKVADRL
jgi:predicted nucleic acid binding AN1-type Zn finger protein